MRILYVEDNEYLRESIAELIAAPGRQVSTCPSGEAALASWQRERFDVLITDVSLPGMSGTELARRLLQDAPGLWIVLCSGYDFGDSASALGPQVRTLVKPFEPEELEAMMRSVEAALRDTPPAR